MLNYIPDGYTDRGFLKGEPRQYGPVHFKFRPILVAERSVIREVTEKKPAGEADQIIAEALAKRIVEWDVCDPGGKTVPITPANCLRLRPELFNRLYWVVSGLGAGDQDPDEPPEEQVQGLDDRLQAAIDGRPVGDVRAEGSEKNSVGG